MRFSSSRTVPGLRLNGARRGIFSRVELHGHCHHKLVSRASRSDEALDDATRHVLFGALRTQGGLEVASDSEPANPSAEAGGRTLALERGLCLVGLDEGGGTHICSPAAKCKYGAAHWAGV